MTSRSRVAVVLFVAMVALLTVTWARTSVVAQAPERVNLALDWIVYGKHVMYYPAIEQGIYQRHGISVTMSRGFGSGDTIQKVDQKAFQFGFADMGSLVLLRAKGAKVTTVGMVHHLMPHAVAFIKGGAIRNPKDLEGKSFSTPAGNAVWVLIPAFARATGSTTPRSGTSRPMRRRREPRSWPGGSTPSGSSGPSIRRSPPRPRPWARRWEPSSTATTASISIRAVSSSTTTSCATSPTSSSDS